MCCGTSSPACHPPSAPLSRQTQTYSGDYRRIQSPSASSSRACATEDPQGSDRTSEAEGELYQTLTQSYHSPTNTISNTHRTAKRSAPRRNKTPVAHDLDGTRLVNPAHSLDQAKQIDLRLPPHRRVVPKAVLFPDRWERECYCESVLRGGNERRCVLHKGPL